MKQHELRPGEWIGIVADTYNFRHWREIWDHDANASLRAQRGEASLLIAGDVLTIPDPENARAVAVSTGKRIVFRVRPRDRVALRIDGIASFIEAFGPIDYEAKVGDVAVSGQLTEDGQEIALPIGSSDEEVEVTLLGHKRVYRLGDVGPADDRCGAFERLRHLGFAIDRGSKPIDPRRDLSDEELRHAVLAFQRAYGLPLSGELDSRTQAALAERYGI